MIAPLQKYLKLQVIRYGIVGILNTLFSYGVFALMVFFDFKYQIASLVSIVIGILFSFMSQGVVVFGGVTTTALARYVSVWCVLYLANILLIDLLVRLSFSIYLAGAVATVPIVVLAYFLMKLFVFQR